ncbi:MAG: hypothetical protein JXR31_16010 [Prolixibacteraceae bacterium]|nr:hypothetical protein [Prolixibacteraceae bacterium]MBN2775761.1 hypothetical protein [Prolixibacteraceae bacterium]
MESWSDNIKQIIKSKLEGTKERDLRFFRIDEFIRNIERTDTFSVECRECSQFKNDISSVVKIIDDAVKIPGENRRRFDRLTGDLSKHMMKKHGFFNPYYFTYLYSFFGMVAGTLVGFLGTRIFPSEDWIALIIGFALGIIVGNKTGSVKDKEIRKNKRLL